MGPTHLDSFAGNFGSPTQLLIILVIVLLLFGGKRLRSLGSDLGNAIKGFKNSMSSDADKTEQEKQQEEAQKILEQSKTPTPTATVSEKNEHKQP